MRTPPSASVQAPASESLPLLDSPLGAKLRTLLVAPEGRNLRRSAGQPMAAAWISCNSISCLPASAATAEPACLPASAARDQLPPGSCSGQLPWIAAGTPAQGSCLEQLRQQRGGPISIALQPRWLDVGAAHGAGAVPLQPLTDAVLTKRVAAFEPHRGLARLLWEGGIMRVASRPGCKAGFRVQGRVQRAGRRGG